MTRSRSEHVTEMMIEDFQCDIDVNVKYVEDNLDDAGFTDIDENFLHSLINFYNTKEYLTRNQIRYMIPYYREMKGID